MPVANTRWSERLGPNRMEQVRELLQLINCKRFDRVVVAMNFTFYQIQPCKERAHPAFEYRGDTDGSREVPEEFARDDIMWRIEMLFNLTGRVSIRDQQRAFSVGNLPPTVRGFSVVFCLIVLTFAMYSFVLVKIHG